MTKLPPPAQWVLSKMTEMEVAEMIEQHIDFYTVDKDGSERSVHLPTQFVRHFMRRHDGALPQRVAHRHYATGAGGRKSAGPEGPRPPARHPVYHSGRAARGCPAAPDCTPERVKAAMEFLCNEWLVDVATDHTGKALLIAAALSLIERSLLDRPAVLLRHRRPARQWQDHGDLHADHGGRRGPCQRRRRGRPTRRSGARH